MKCTFLRLNRINHYKEEYRLIALFVSRHLNNCFAHTISILWILQWKPDGPLVRETFCCVVPIITNIWERRNRRNTKWKTGGKELGGVCWLKLITTFLLPRICLVQHSFYPEHLNIFLIKSTHYTRAAAAAQGSLSIFCQLVNVCLLRLAPTYYNCLPGRIYSSLKYWKSQIFFSWNYAHYSLYCILGLLDLLVK